MDYSAIQDIFVKAIYLIMMLTIVVVLPGMLVGFLISILQAATQINEMSISFVPKLVVTLLSMLISGSWIMNQLISYATDIFTNMKVLLE